MTNTATTPSGQPLGISHKPSATEAMFDRLKAENKPAFIGYLPYGFPNPDISLDALRIMVEHGVDAVEIGLPYSDPVMDGPVIQAASQIALNNGESINGVFKAVETVANADGVPLIMSYWNLIYHYGVERFACDFENAGGAGLITPDLIPDEAGEWIEASDRHGLDRIFLVSPDSASERLELVARNARGFVYAASRMGVTGERDTAHRPKRLSSVPATPGRETCAWVSAYPPRSRARRSAPTPTASSSVLLWCTPCLTTTTSPRRRRRKDCATWPPRSRRCPRASTTSHADTPPRRRAAFTVHPPAMG